MDPFFPHKPSQASIQPRADPARVDEAQGSAKFLFLESTRGMAAVVVLFHHLILAFFPAIKESHLWGAPPLAVMHSGSFAVRLFFTLSGFVLSYKFFLTGDKDLLTSAALRRYFRLMLPTAVSVLVGWLILTGNLFYNKQASVLMSYPETSWLSSQFDCKIGIGGALKQASLGTFFNFDAQRTLNPSLWTMPIELMGSFFVFSLLALLGTVRRRWIIYAIMTALFCRFKFESWLVDFLMGIFLADILSSVRLSKNQETIPLFVPVSMLFSGLFLGGLDYNWWVANAGHMPSSALYLPSVATGLIVLAILISPPLQRLLNLKWLAFLGKISFSLYLIHLCLLCSLSSFIYVKCRAAHWEHLASGLAASGACIIAAFLLAWVLYRLVDAPAIQVSKRVANYFLGRR